MTQSSLCVLLDANIIIEAHALNVWASIVQRVTLVVPATVLAEATHYTSPQTGMRMEIHLETAVREGVIREVSATAEQLAELVNRLTLSSSSVWIGANLRHWRCCSLASWKIVSSVPLMARQSAH